MTGREVRVKVRTWGWMCRCSPVWTMPAPRCQPHTACRKSEVWENIPLGGITYMVKMRNDLTNSFSVALLSTLILTWSTHVKTCNPISFESCLFSTSWEKKQMALTLKYQCRHEVYVPDKSHSKWILIVKGSYSWLKQESVKALKLDSKTWAWWLKRQRLPGAWWVSPFPATPTTGAGWESLWGGGKQPKLSTL